MAWQRVSEVIPVDDDDYQLRLTEERSGDNSMVFIHLKVKRWTSSVLKRLLRDFKLLRQHVTCPLFCYADDDDEKWEHFVTHFGFRPLTTVLLNNGEARRLFFSETTPHELQRKQEDRDHQRERYEEPLVGPDAVSADRV